MTADGCLYHISQRYAPRLTLALCYYDANINSLTHRKIREFPWEIYLGEELLVIEYIIQLSGLPNWLSG